MGALTRSICMGHLERWPCGFSGTGTSSTCHGTWPFAVVECVVSRWETSVDAVDATSILLSICSSVLLSTRNSRRHLEVDLCTAQTRNGNKIQNTVRTSVTSIAIIPMIPSSDIVLTRSSIGLCGNGVLLPEYPSRYRRDHSQHFIVDYVVQKRYQYFEDFY